MINVPSFSSWNGRLFGKCDFDYWTSFRPLFLLSQMSCTEKVDKCTSMRGCIIVDDNDEDDYNDGGRKRRATSIEHCLHSIEQIGSAPLLVSRLHAWTRKCGPSHRILHYPPPWRNMNEKGEGATDANARSMFPALIA